MSYTRSPQIVIRRRGGMGANKAPSTVFATMDQQKLAASTPLVQAVKPVPILIPLAPAPAPVSAPFDQAAADAAFARLVAQTAANTTPWTPDPGNIAKQAALDATAASIITAKQAPAPAPVYAPVMLDQKFFPQMVAPQQSSTKEVFTPAPTYAPIVLDQKFIPQMVAPQQSSTKEVFTPAPTYAPVVLDQKFIPQMVAPPVNPPSNTPAAQRIMEALSPSTGGSPQTGRTGVFVEDPFKTSIPNAQTAATNARRAPFAPGPLDAQTPPQRGMLIPSQPPPERLILAPDETQVVPLYPGAPPNLTQFDRPPARDSGGGGGGGSEDELPEDPRVRGPIHTSIKPPFPWWIIAIVGYYTYKHWSK